MFCNRTICDDAGDSINVIINENNRKGNMMNINYENIGQQRVWDLNLTLKIVLKLR